MTNFADGRVLLEPFCDLNPSVSLLYLPDSSLPPNASSQDDAFKAFVSRSASGKSTLSASGRASDQPKRTPVSNEEMEAILVMQVLLKLFHSLTLALPLLNIKLLCF